MKKKPFLEFANKLVNKWFQNSEVHLAREWCRRGSEYQHHPFYLYYEDDGVFASSYQRIKPYTRGEYIPIDETIDHTGVVA